MLWAMLLKCVRALQSSRSRAVSVVGFAVMQPAAGQAGPQNLAMMVALHTLVCNHLQVVLVPESRLF